MNIPLDEVKVNMTADLDLKGLTGLDSVVVFNAHQREMGGTHV